VTQNDHLAGRRDWQSFHIDEMFPMRILFLHGWTSVTGGVKPTFLKDHGHTVFNPKLPEEAVQIAQEEFDKHKPHVVVGSRRGCGDEHQEWRCPARRALPGVESVGIGEDGQARHGDPASTSRRRDPFRRLRGTGRTSGLPASALIEVGKGSPMGRPGAAGKDVEGVWLLLMLQRRWD